MNTTTTETMTLNLDDAQRAVVAAATGAPAPAVLVLNVAEQTALMRALDRAELPADPDAADLVGGLVTLLMIARTRRASR